MERTVVLTCLLSLFCAVSSTGIWQETNTHGQRVKNAAKYASIRINDRSNSNFYVKLIHIHTATIQIVAGINYNITFDIGLTVCRKNELEEELTGNCYLNPNSVVERCWATVWELPSLNKIQLLQDWCYPYMSYSQYFADVHISEEKKAHF
ncbi:putative cysteine proteinase-like protein [Leptotrombidium deliense]|uniref:Putative cysteine proteinase-like protein n=1 Tax=Leptotrombidium deliense TaxID=299467 RepID=A0A443SUA5_9ACAR|nr:putative cysteine proteinase-like protein [Leptotrombidium deliense]